MQVFRFFDNSGYAKATQCYVIRGPTLPAFLGVFQKLRKTAISFVICVYFSVLSNGPSWLLLDGFSLSYIIDYFSKFVEKIQI